MQPQFPPSNPRQRPLQKSMFLPTSQQYINRNTSVQYQYQDIMKRASINTDNSTKLHNYQLNQTYMQTQTQVHNQFNQISSNPTLSFNSTPRHAKQGQVTRVSQYQHFVQNQPNNDLSMMQLQQKVQKLTFLVDVHQEILKKHNFLNLNDKSLIQTQIQQIQSRLKDNLIPNIINKETKQIYQHVFDFKLQINSLKQEVSKINDRFKTQFIAFTNNASNNSKSISTSNSSERIQRRQEPISELTVNVHSLQLKMSEIQKNIQTKNDDLKLFILAQIQKNQTQNRGTPTKLKPSTIQSTLSPILLEYRELFVARNLTGPSSLTRIPFSSPKTRDFNNQTQIVISSSTYYIDKQGYLLDNQNRYITDAKGLQIRLEQKHLCLLREHHVLG